MANSTLRLDKRRPLLDGTFPVQIKVGHGTNIYIRTGIYLRPEEWDDGLRICKGLHARGVNSVLKSLLTQVSNRILELREKGIWDGLTHRQIRQLLTNTALDAPTVDVPTLGEYVEKVRELRTGRTKVSYSTTLARLRKYRDPYAQSFSDMSYSWFDGFVKNMRDDGLKPNTIAKYLKCVKVVVKYALEDGVPVNPAHTKVRCRVDRDTPMRNLPLEVMRRVRDASLRSRTAMYRDAFMLSFYLIGINMVDLLELPKDCIVNGRLLYKRAKTGKNYSIKIEPEARAIIDRYPGKTHLLCFGEKAKAFRFNCNDLLGKLEKGLTWYWARYSWANYAVDLDVPKDIISEALGHTHGSAVTGIYIRYSLDKVDKANREVIDYLNAE